MANAIWDGFSGSTDFYSITITIFKDAQPRIQNITFIETESAIVQISSTGTVLEQMIHFETISSTQAHKYTRKVLDTVF